MVSLRFEPGSHFNVIHGDNGAGKSNLLEAIYYLGALKSFRGAKTDDLIGIDAERALVEARLEGGPAPQKLRVELGACRAASLATRWKASLVPPALGIKRCAWFFFHPGDLVLAAGSADKRRAFLDRILEQMDPIYASTLASYEKALRSRQSTAEGGTDRSEVGSGL